MTTTTLEKEIIGLENAYWKALMDYDKDTIGRLTADRSIVSGAQGVSQMDRKTLQGMVTSDVYKIDKYQFIGDPIVESLDKDTAIIGYTVREEMTVEGKPVKLEAADTSVWRRKGDGWVCVLHTESILGDSFGRDRSAK